MFEFDAGKRPTNIREIPRELPYLPKEISVLDTSFDFQAAAERAQLRRKAALKSRELPAVKKAPISSRSVYRAVTKLTSETKSGVLVRDIRIHIHGSSNQLSAALGTLVRSGKLKQMIMEFGYWRTYYPASKYDQDVKPYKTRLVDQQQQAALDILMEFSDPINWRVIGDRLGLSEARAHAVIQGLRKWGLVERIGHSRKAGWRYTGL